MFPTRSTLRGCYDLFQTTGMVAMSGFVGSLLLVSLATKAFELSSTAGGYYYYNNNERTKRSLSSGAFITPWMETRSSLFTTTFQNSNARVGVDRHSNIVRNQWGKRVGFCSRSSVQCEMVKWPSLLPRNGSDTKDTKQQQQQRKKKKNSSSNIKNRKIEIGPRIGSGSYGTVHYCTFVVDKGDDDNNTSNSDGDDKEGEPTVMVCKRAWREDEIASSLVKAAPSSSDEMDPAENKNHNVENDGSEMPPQNHKQMVKKKKRTASERAQRCEHFLSVERHCFEKLQRDFYPEDIEDDVDDASGTQIPSSSSSKRTKRQIPYFWGVHQDTTPEKNKWLVFELRKRGKHKRKTQKEDGTSSETSFMMEVPQPAASLADAIYTDWKKQHGELPLNKKQQQNTSYTSHHLDVVQQEMGLPRNATFGDTLDAFFLSLLKVISEIHNANIVHRDLKPANLLLDRETQSLVLIDFGSAADMDPVSGGGNQLLASMGLGNGGRVGLDTSTVAISPIYAAPEVFVRWDKEPLVFDVFSAALIYCQLLFNLLDDRTDAAFRQQLEDANYDLDAWLERELASTVRPAGFEDGLQYVAERPGLWGLLKKMLHPDPLERQSARSSLRRFKKVLNGYENPDEDGTYFRDVIEASNTCNIPDSLMMMDDGDENTSTDTTSKDSMGSSNAGDSTTMTPSVTEGALVMPRPLHFVSTFDRSMPLGLLLSEAGADDQEELLNEMEDEEAKQMWKSAIASANQPTDVLVRGVVEGGQADEMNIYEIGDRLVGVGEIPVGNGGFEKVVELIQNQPKSSKAVTLHFDRISKPQRIVTTASTAGGHKSAHAISKVSPHLAKVESHGAWSAKGRRQTQEDAFLLHELHDGRGNEVLLAGIFDGHGGTAASTSVSKTLPGLFASEIASMSSRSEETGRATTNASKGVVNDNGLKTALSRAWDGTCEAYRWGCDEHQGECVAEYDPIHGIVQAGTGSKDMVAGTTGVAAVVSISEHGGEMLHILNCGDSRAVLVGKPKQDETNRKKHNHNDASSYVYFHTRDHSPDDPLEYERLVHGRDVDGLDYSLPQCSFNRWWLSVGDYQYAVSRSLEGNFATSKGITSDADVTAIYLPDVLDTYDQVCLILASDGMYEVMDNEEIALRLTSLRETGFCARDAAKNLAAQAIKKGSSDNVSCVILYFS